MTQSILKLKRVAALSIVCLGIASLTASAQEVISLQEAVNRTLANNLTIKQALVTEKLGNEDYKAAQYNQLPTLNANSQGGYYFGKTQVLGAFAYASSTLNINGSAQAQLTIFQGGQLRNQILQNKLSLDVDKTSTSKIKNDLLLNVVTDYLVILTDQDLVIAANQQIDLAKITLDRAQKNFDQ
ncbi:MAG: TolC family protein, partial [Mucilaginibacter sp.]